MHSEGYNLAAEALQANPTAQAPPIAPGARDPLRLSIDKSEIGGRFRSAKLTVIEMLR